MGEVGEAFEVMYQAWMEKHSTLPVDEIDPKLLKEICKGWFLQGIKYELTDWKIPEEV